MVSAPPSTAAQPRLWGPQCRLPPTGQGWAAGPSGSQGSACLPGWWRLSLLMADGEAVPRIWGQGSLGHVGMPVGVQVIATYLQSLCPFTEGKPEGRMPHQVGGGPGPRTRASHSESMSPPCSAQTEEGSSLNSQATSSPVPTEPKSAEPSLRAAPADTMPASCRKRQIPARAWALYRGWGASTAGGQVTGDCSGTTRRDEVGGSVQKGLAEAHLWEGRPWYLHGDTGQRG